MRKYKLQVTSGDIVLLSEEDYRSILETLYLWSLPGMKEKIIQGIETPLDDCVEY